MPTKQQESPKKETSKERRKAFREVFNERLDNETRMKIAEVLITQIFDESLRASDRRSAIELILDILGEFEMPVQKEEVQKIVLKIE